MSIIVTRNGAQFTYKSWNEGARANGSQSGKNAVACARFLKSQGFEGADIDNVLANVTTKTNGTPRIYKERVLSNAQIVEALINQARNIDNARIQVIETETRALVPQFTNVETAQTALTRMTELANELNAIQMRMNAGAYGIDGMVEIFKTIYKEYQATKTADANETK